MRLHITPLNQDILPTVLGTKLIEIADNITYHSLQTYPENNYGFLDLPDSDALKLISKLNRAILKGRKMKVQEAQTKKRSLAPAFDEISESSKSRKKSKKEDGVLAGEEIDKDRIVKRGWTEPKKDSRDRKAKSKPEKEKEKQLEKKSQAPSKYTEKQELLFRTKIPDNKAELVSTKKRKIKKGKHTDETVVHEFEKRTSQPSFLRDKPSESQPTAEFVDGKGWVDATGNVLEEPPKVRVSKRNRLKKSDGLRISIPEVATSPAPDADEASSQADVLSSTIPGTNANLAAPEVVDEETSSSGTSSSESESSEDDTSAPPTSSEKPAASARLETPPTVHPLEALFKKPLPAGTGHAARPSLELDTGFSFFENGQQEEESQPVPATPFTSHDRYSRGMRSAAPTPDTAHPSRFSSFAEAMDSRLGALTDEEMQDDSDEDTPKASTAAASAPSSEKVETEFEKRFWKERSANNKAWKASRRAALKEQRQRQNRLQSAKKWK